MFTDIMFEENLALLEALCQNKLTVKEWVARLKSQKWYYEEIELEEIPEPIRTHEREHAEVIRKYGLRPKFVKSKEGIYAVAFDPSELEGWSREEVLQFLLELYGAPSSYSAYDHLAFYLIYFSLQK